MPAAAVLAGEGLGAVNLVMAAGATAGGEILAFDQYVNGAAAIWEHNGGGLADLGGGDEGKNRVRR